MTRFGRSCFIGTLTGRHEFNEWFGMDMTFRLY